MQSAADGFAARRGYDELRSYANRKRAVEAAASAPPSVARM
jgi:hypothetical protein